jgi:hypothetical protein
MFRYATQLQAHLNRDRKQGQLVKHLTKEQDALFKWHKKAALAAARKGLTGEALIQELDDRAVEFEKRLLDITKKHTATIKREGMQAEKQLKLIHQDMQDKLKNELKELSWAKKNSFDDLESHTSSKKLQAMRDRKRKSEEKLGVMLGSFEKHMRGLEHLTVTEQVLVEWESTLDGVKSGAIDYEEGEKSMLTLMESATHGPLKQREGETVVEAFEDTFIELKAVHKQLVVLDMLRSWKRGELDVHKVLLKVQELIYTNDVDPNWLLAPKDTTRDKENLDNQKAEHDFSELFQTVDKMHGPADHDH